MINAQLVCLTSRLHTCSAAEDANDRGEVFLINSIQSLNAAHHLFPLLSFFSFFSAGVSFFSAGDTLNGIEVIQPVQAWRLRCVGDSVAPAFSCPLLNISYPASSKGNPRWNKNLVKLIRDTLINHSVRHKATTPTVTPLLFSPSVRPKREFLLATPNFIITL